jgi:hypothetical protein
MFWPDQPDQPVTAVGTAMIAAQPVSNFMTVFSGRPGRTGWSRKLW